MSLHSKVFIGTSVAKVSEKTAWIEGDGRGSSGRTAAAAPAPTGRRQQTVQTAARAGRRQQTGARAGSPCRRARPCRKPLPTRARARRLTGARAGSPCMRAHSAGQRARAPCGLCLPARARPVRAVPACARAPRAGSAGQRARAPCGQCRPARARPVRAVPASARAPRACCADQRARAACGLCRPARARPVRTVPACARAPRADSAGPASARAPVPACARAPRAGGAGQRARAPCGQCRPARARPVRAVPARARAPRAGSACLRARAPCGQCRPTWARRQTAADGRARADSPCRPARARRQPLPTSARAQTAPADLRARSLADHCRRARRPGRPLPTHAHAWADHCPTCALAWPTTADARACLGRPLPTGRACLGRPLPMHVCLRAGMCAGAWAGPCRRGRVGAGGRQQRSRATSGRPVAVHLTFGVCGPGRRPFPPGCRHILGTRTASKATGTDDVRRSRGTWTARPVRACWVFVISRKAPSLSCGCAHHARPVAHFSSGTWHSFDPGLGPFFLDPGETRHTEPGQGHRARTTVAPQAEGRGRARPAPSLSCGSSHTLALWHIFHLGLGTCFDPGLGHFFLTRAKQGTRAGGSPSCRARDADGEQGHGPRTTCRRRPRGRGRPDPVPRVGFLLFHGQGTISFVRKRAHARPVAQF
ncbi:UNVERIFIED_CONTAM: hypothetical protein Sindi_2997000 [Sesamum indicum]